MLHFIISILAILITIFFVIGTHEFAHFYTARLLGVKVLRFSIGFGRTLYRWFDKAGTEYIIALIPLGGYVKMLDETEEEVKPEEKHLAFNNQPYYKKFLIVLAGPVTNILCALIIYTVIFIIGFNTVKPIIGEVNPNSIASSSGLKAQQEIIKADGSKILDWGGFILRLILHAGDKDQMKVETRDEKKSTEHHILNLRDWKLEGLNPDPLGSIGIVAYTPDIPLTIGKFANLSPAKLAGLKLNDKIMAIDNKPIKDWKELNTTIKNHPNEKMIFTIERNKEIIKIPVVIGYKQSIFNKKSGYLGISPQIEIPKHLLREIKYPPFLAMFQAGKQIYKFVYFNFILIGKLITGKLSLQSLGGPLTIFDIAGTTLNLGIISFLSFLAFFSISIGVINLLPIPGLDGGHLVFQTIEFIMGKPIPLKIIFIFYRLGFLLILILLSIALINDLLRL